MQTRSEQVEQWMALVQYVVTNKFWWVYEESGTDANRRLQRSISRDDLVQEGSIGLLAAIDGYDADHPSESKFKTYASAVIYRTIKSYIRDNISALKVGRSEDVQRTGSEFTKQQYRAATNYVEFSDLRTNRRDIDEVPFAPTPPRNVMWDDGPEVVMADAEELQKHIGALREGMDHDLLSVLLARFSGKTWKQIGDHYEKSDEWARRTGVRAMENARRILLTAAQIRAEGPGASASALRVRKGQGLGKNRKGG